MIRPEINAICFMVVRFWLRIARADVIFPCLNCAHHRFLQRNQQTSGSVWFRGCVSSNDWSVSPNNY